MISFRYCLVLLTGLFIFPTLISAQSQAFVKVYGDSSFQEQAAGVVQAADQSVYVLGNISNTPNLGHQIVLNKFTPDGKAIWQKFYGGPLNESGDAVVLQKADILLITGSIYNPQTGNKDALFMRIDTSGHMVQTWTTTDTFLNEVFKTACVLPDGSFLASGSISDPNGNGNDTYLRFFNAEGQPQWIANFRDSLENDIAHASAAIPEGGFLVAGERQLADKTYRPYLLNINKFGDTQWVKTLDYGTNGGSQNILRTQSGEYWLVGEAFPDSQNFFFDYLVVAFDSTGTEKWHRYYGDVEADACFSIAEVKRGYFVLGGYGYNPAGQSTDFYMVLVDSTGSEMLEWYWGQNRLDMTLGLIAGQAGGIYAAGFLTTQENDLQYVLYHEPLAFLSTSIAKKLPLLETSLFPNPVSRGGILHARDPIPPALIRVVGLDGKLHFQVAKRQPWQHLAVPDSLAGGLYILNIQTQRQIYRASIRIE
ncbi:MAG: hypothetical protein AAFR61_06230 [Bacteroidota bacterium]